MIPDVREERLSRITTRWTLVDEAHRGPGDAAAAARAELWRRYGGAAHRYLLGALRDADAAADGDVIHVTLARGELECEVRTTKTRNDETAKKTA